MQTKPITQAIDDIRQGRMIILVDDDDRENEGDLVFAASLSTPEKVNVMMSYGRGLICMPMSREKTRALKLPQQVFHNEAHLSTAFTVSIDAAHGISTGISAADRNTTILAACAPEARPEALVRPGHIFPLEAKEGGVLVRPGHTEASVDFSRLAGCQESAVICEILNEKGEASRMPELIKLSKALGLNIYTIKDLVDYRMNCESLVRKVSKSPLQSEYGNFILHRYRAVFGSAQEDFVALTHGKEHFDATDIPLVRVHAEWSIVNVLNRLSNPEGSRLNMAMRQVAEHGLGAIVFIRHSPSSEKSIFDTRRTPPDLWFEDGLFRSLGEKEANMGYGLGAQILRDLGIGRMKLLSDSSAGFKGIGNYGLEIMERVSFNPSSATKEMDAVL